ncbi:META domain-containing protein [Chloroflexota bacterium]
MLEDTEITATFDSTEEKVTGSASCNNYFGGYELEGSKLTLPGPIGSTMMSCGEQIDKQEYEYLTTLEAAESYKIEGDKLRINCGEQVLIFNQK